MNKHTPGPWKRVGKGIGCVEGANGRPVAIIQRNIGQQDEDAGNLALVIAAPVLLAALEALIVWDEGGIEAGELPGDLIDAARAAIAKARGGS